MTDIFDMDTVFGLYPYLLILIIGIELYLWRKRQRQQGSLPFKSLLLALYAYLAYQGVGYTLFGGISVWMALTVDRIASQVGEYSEQYGEVVDSWPDSSASDSLARAFDSLSQNVDSIHTGMKEMANESFLVGGVLLVLGLTFLTLSVKRIRFHLSRRSRPRD